MRYKLLKESSFDWLIKDKGHQFSEDLFLILIDKVIKANKVNGNALLFRLLKPELIPFEVMLSHV